MLNGCTSRSTHTLKRLERLGVHCGGLELQEHSQGICRVWFSEYACHVTIDIHHLPIMGKPDCVCSPNSIIIKNTIMLYQYLLKYSGMLPSGSRKIPFYDSWLPLVYLTYTTLQYAFSTTRNSSKLVVARVYCLLSLCDVDMPLHSAVYKYFLLAAEMCAYLHAIRNHIFRVVILSEHRGMDYIVHMFDSVGLENISSPITCSIALRLM